MVATETKKRVHTACQELDYRPNSLISELAVSRWRADKASKGSVIAFIVRARREADAWDAEPALRQQASLLGYQLECFHRVDFVSSAKLQRVLRSRGITDVILGSLWDESLNVELDWSKFVCVQLLPQFSPLPLHSVVKDHFNAVVLSWQKAVSSGYKRIGIDLLEHPVSMVDDIMRVSAAHACQRRFFTYLPKLPHFRSVFGKPSIDAFAKWFKTYKPDVLIEFSEFQFRLDRSKVCPDIPYVCLHTPESDGASGILEDRAICAREAVQLLHFCRRTYQFGVPDWRIDHVIEPKWVEGNSMPPKKAA